MCVCVCMRMCVPFQYVFRRVFEGGEAFRKAMVDAAGRVRTTGTYTTPPRASSSSVWRGNH